MNPIWKALVIANLAALLAFAGYYFFGSSHQHVYIDTYKLYNGFSMKKQLQHNLEEDTRKRKQQLDSLKLEINMAMADAQQQMPAKELKNAFELKRREYLMREEQSGREQEDIAERYDAQIWAQLNQYINDYGKEQQVDFIFGASGNGSLMYGKESHDITEEMIRYVNEKHKGL